MIVINQITPANASEHWVQMAELLGESVASEIAKPAGMKPQQRLLIAYNKGQAVGCLSMKPISEERAQIENFHALGKESEEIADLLLLKAIDCGRRLGWQYLQADKASMPMKDVFTPGCNPEQQLFQLDLRDCITGY